MRREKLDEAGAEELVALPLLRPAAHGDQPVGAVVEGDPHAAVEGEPLAHRRHVVALEPDRAEQQVGRLAAGVEGAVAQVLLQLGAVRRRQAVDPALEAEHGEEGAVLAVVAGPVEHREGGGEVADVVDHPVALDPRIDHPGLHEVERPGGGGEAELAAGDGPARRQLAAQHDAAADLDRHDQPAQAVDQLELLELEEQPLPHADQWRRQQPRRVVGLEGRQVGEIAGADEQVAAAVARVRLEQVGDGGAQGGVDGELLEVPARELLQPPAQVAAVDAQRAGEVAGQLGEVAADVVLGEQEDAVAQAGQQAGEERLLPLLGGDRQPRREVVDRREHPVEEAVEDAVFDGVAVAAADLAVPPEDTFRHILEEARHVERVLEPEDGGVLAAIAGDGGVLDRPAEQDRVAVPGLRVGLDVVPLAPQPGHLHGLLGGHEVAQGGAQVEQAGREEDREPLEGGGALVLQEDRARHGEHPLEVGHQAPRFLRVGRQEVEGPLQGLEKGRRVHTRAFLSDTGRTCFNWKRNDTVYHTLGAGSHGSRRTTAGWAGGRMSFRLCALSGLLRSGAGGR